MNSTALASRCGTFAQSWRDVSTPMFVVAGQFDQDYFARFTCGVTPRAEDYQEINHDAIKASVKKEKKKEKEKEKERSH